MIGDIGRLFQRAAVLQIRGDTGGAESMIADRRVDSGRHGPALHEPVGIGLQQAIT